MSSLAPISVALKFGFLAVMYLFLLWVSRSALADRPGARRGRVEEPTGGVGGRGSAADGAYAGGWGSTATGLHSASAVGRVDLAQRAPRLVVRRAPGHDAGMIYDIDADLVLGRGERAEIRLEDPFASSRHARVYRQAGAVVLEDLDSTNGTYLNEELLDSPRPLHPGDHVRIGDSEFVFEVDR